MKMSRIIVEWGMSPYADGMKDVILNTSELVLTKKNSVSNKYPPIYNLHMRNLR